MIDQEDRIPYEALCMKNSIGMCTQLRNEIQVYYTVQSSELTCFKCWSALQLCVFSIKTFSSLVVKSNIF